MYLESCLDHFVVFSRGAASILVQNGEYGSRYLRCVLGDGWQWNSKKNANASK